MKIRFKLAILVAGTLVVLLPVLSYIYYLNVRKTFLEQIYAHLESICETKAIRLRDVAEKRFELLSLVSTQPNFQRALENKPSGLTPEIVFEIQSTFRRYGKALKSINDINICNLEGKVYLSNSVSNIGMDFSDRRSFKEAKKGIFWGDFHKNAVGKLNTYLSGPLYNSKNELHGIIIMETDASELHSLTSDYTGLGKTGETVIGVGEYGTMLLNKLRFDNDGVITRMIDPTDTLIPMNKALRGMTGIMKAGKDYRKVEVIASLRYISTLSWGVVTKLDKEEAFEPINKLLKHLIMINIFGISITFLIAFIFSGIISMPIESLIKTVEKMKSGDLSKRAEISANDEIGSLAQSFNELAQNLERKIADIENFAYTASHDLKAPIANLEGLLTALVKSLNGRTGPKEEQLLSMFAQSIAKFKNTIQDLSEVTKVQLSPSEDIGLVDLEDIFSEVKQNIQNLIVESGADIRLNFKIRSIRFSRKDLNSILHNLITNAIKYSSPERRPVVEISAERIANQVLITVKDNGLGFDPQYKDKLFMMFKRLHTHVEGSGIGLYLLKRIVTMNGGRIEVETKPDVGSSFYIYLNA